MDLKDLSTSLDNSTEEAIQLENDLDSIDDLMSDLDSLVAKEKKSKKRADPNEWNRPAPFVQQWYPEAIALRARIQVCQCGEAHAHNEGVFLRSVTRNGAIRWTAVSKAEMELLKNLPRERDYVEEPVDHCICCWETTK